MLSSSVRSSTRRDPSGSDDSALRRQRVKAVTLKPFRDRQEIELAARFKAIDVAAAALVSTTRRFIEPCGYVARETDQASEASRRKPLFGQGRATLRWLSGSPRDAERASHVPTLVERR